MDLQAARTALDEGDSVGGALYLAHLAAAAYAEPRHGYRCDRGETVRYQNLGLDHVKSLLGKGNCSEGFLAHSGRNVFVVFKGTCEREDWITDALVRASELGLAGVHTGFLRAYRLAEPEINRYLAGGLCRGKRLWLVGHSLGGALAKLSAAILFANGGPVTPAHVVTFGAPRAGDDKFRLLYRNFELAPLTTQFVNENDVVAYVPFKVWGYRHASQGHIFCPEVGKPRPLDLDRSDRTEWSWKSLCDFYVDRLGPFLRSAIGGEHPHAMSCYLRRLGRV